MAGRKILIAVLIKIRSADPTRTVQPLAADRIGLPAANRNGLRKALQVLEQLSLGRTSQNETEQDQQKNLAKQDNFQPSHRRRDERIRIHKFSVISHLNGPAPAFFKKMDKF